MLPETAHALRPIRILEKQNEIRNYEATTFKNPLRGCRLYMNRCKQMGWLKDGGNLAIDVLDADGDILDTFPITRRGFNYLRGKLKFRVER